jgi:outer membrane biosynthesis protein TonB
MKKGLIVYVTEGKQSRRVGGSEGKGETEGTGSHGVSPVGGGSFPGEFEVQAVDHAPQALQKVEPIYPPRGHRQGICGRVVVRFLVEPNGHV